MEQRTPRQVSRELALLSLSQMPNNMKKLADDQQISRLILAAVRTLTTEIQQTLDNARDELQRGNDKLLSSETRTTDLHISRTMVKESIGYTQSAINQLAGVLEFSELIPLANQEKQYAKELVITVNKNQAVIDEDISQSLVDWQLNRLAQIDRDILRIAVAEMKFLDIHRSIAINEAVLLAKRYSGEDSHRFINGVLRRFSDSELAKV
jgi:transcription antitermination protein NusB